MEPSKSCKAKLATAVNGPRKAQTDTTRQPDAKLPAANGIPIQTIQQPQ